MDSVAILGDLGHRFAVVEDDDGQPRCWCGGQATVYLAKDRQTDALLAVKLPHDLDQEAVLRFENEQLALAHLRDDNVVPVLELGKNPPYIVYRYIDGDNLGNLLKHSRPPRFDPMRAARLVQSLAETLQRVHDHDIIHRDVKPSNILVDRRGKVYLTDFGIAFIDFSRRHPTRMDRGRRAVLGSPRYISPQQALGHHPAAADDQYSLGVVLYELLTGRTPLPEDHPTAVLARLIDDDVPGPRTLGIELPPPLEAILLQALAKDRGRRYPSCRELAADLGRFRAGLPVRASQQPPEAAAGGVAAAQPAVSRGPGTTAPEARHPRRAPGRRFASLVVVLSAAALATFGGWLYWHRSPAAGPPLSLLTAGHEGGSTPGSSSSTPAGQPPQAGAAGTAKPPVPGPPKDGEPVDVTGKLLRRDNDKERQDAGRGRWVVLRVERGNDPGGQMILSDDARLQALEYPDRFDLVIDCPGGQGVIVQRVEGLLDGQPYQLDGHGDYRAVAHGRTTFRFSYPKKNLPALPGNK